MSTAHRLTLIFLIAVASSSWTTGARAADDCKICRDYNQACVKAHSAAACKSEYDICIKHCQRK
jgi:hypothetical protein